MFVEIMVFIWAKGRRAKL